MNIKAVTNRKKRVNEKIASLKEGNVDEMMRLLDDGAAIDHDAGATTVEFDKSA